MGAPIELAQLTRSYGKHRGVIEVDLSVREGEIFAFLGPNGAGKTTTIRVLMGLLRPTSGRAQIFGLDCWRDAARVKALIGFCPGEMRLYEGLTGKEFLDLFAGFRPRSDPRRRATLTDRLDLDTARRIRQLSRGNRQKLAVVQALMHEAPLLILDEPSSGLDPLKQQTFLELLLEEKAAGRTIFLSSHAIPDVERVADRVGILREGRLIAVEQITALKDKRSRRADVTFTEPIAPERLALDGIRVLDRDADGRRFSLAVSGEVAAFLRILVALPVDDLRLSEADLDTIFRQYYSDEAVPA